MNGYANEDSVVTNSSADDPGMELDPDGVWELIRCEAAAMAEGEPVLAPFLRATVLAKSNLTAALAAVLDARLGDAAGEPPADLDAGSEESAGVWTGPGEGLLGGALAAAAPATLADLAALRVQDVACTSHSAALLFHAGFHALQLHRAAHALWQQNAHSVALRLQALGSRALAADIHPAATFGPGVVLLQPMGLVVGEAAVVGTGGVLMQYVTLGGTGKDSGDRHPKLAAAVRIGPKATILGNIAVGRGAHVGAGSLVLKPVPEGAIVMGSPVRDITRDAGIPHGNIM